MDKPCYGYNICGSDGETIAASSGLLSETKFCHLFARRVVWDSGTVSIEITQSDEV